MNKTLLVTRSRHDEATNYLYYFAEQVIREAQQRNFKILDLVDKKANYNDFSGRIRKTEPDLIFLNGHGSPTSIAGYNDEILISVDKNISLLKNKITYALSCSSAKKLGKYAIKNGAKSFIGYKENFIFMHEQDKSTRPTEDKTAKLFFEPSNLIVTTLIKGNTPKEAFNRSQKEFKNNLRKLMTSESPQGNKSSIPWLYWDMIHQVCLCDAKRDTGI